jgi:hypothetical protein
MTRCVLYVAPAKNTGGTLRQWGGKYMALMGAIGVSTVAGLRSGKGCETGKLIVRRGREGR